MDLRQALRQGTILNLGGMNVVIGVETGRGSNAIVYEAAYRDATQSESYHYVLIKELFPLNINGGIYRDADGKIVHNAEAEEFFKFHRRSFEAGNRAHLRMLGEAPDRLGANINTYEYNGTLYSILGASGGKSLSERINDGASLKKCIRRTISILNSLRAFHDAKLLHLDIAPDNIIMLGEGDEERAMLIDYNSCMSIEALAGEENLVLSVKQGYTSPEIRSRRIDAVGYASDLYSVAAVFFQMLNGSPLTAFQMTRGTPPDLTVKPILTDKPESVKSLAMQILKKGLAALPARRYQSADEMIRDLNELIDRIDSVGITHWALWEAGKQQISRLMSQNPALMFIKESSKLYPANIADENTVTPLEEYPFKENALIVGEAGIGKTTSLIRLAAYKSRKYTERESAYFYLPLYGLSGTQLNYISNSLLEYMRFKPDTGDFESARGSLKRLLRQRLSGDAPTLTLLLDGLNELSGDMRALNEEIMTFASLEGVRLLICTRQDDGSIPFKRIKLCPLSEEDVRRALGENGLLMPESEDMRGLIRTPLMLKMFISSSRAENRQLRVDNREELLSAYFEALKTKEAKNHPDDSPALYQTDAAINYVLPALANEMKKRRSALDESEMLSLVEKCYKRLHTRFGRRLFPQWTGFTSAIFDGCENEEEWYGRIVHEIIFKSLGLLIKDENGKYRIFHQVIEEYLTDRYKPIGKRIKRRSVIKTSAAALAGVACVCAVILYVLSLPQPLPYDEGYADAVMGYAIGAYVSLGEQYSALEKLTEAAEKSPEDYSFRQQIYTGTSRVVLTRSKISLASLKLMTDSGDVMPWSGKPMNESACETLLSLPEQRKSEYELYYQVLDFVMNDETAYRNYSEDYISTLKNLLETDARINAELYMLVLEPHVSGKYALDSPTASSYSGLLTTVPDQNAFLEVAAATSYANELDVLIKRRATYDPTKTTAYAAYEYGRNK